MNPLRMSAAFPIAETSQVGDVRRRAQRLAASLGFSEVEAGEVAIIATELATNVLKHAGKGELVLRALDDGQAHRGVEILALDKGPGILDLPRSMEDGYSTVGSSGTGLGAVSRLANVFEVYSSPGQGTAILAQRWAAQCESMTQVGAVCLPLHGEEACGDGWTSHTRGSITRLLVSDGLGHGKLAAEASDMAAEVFHRHPETALDELCHILHRALQSTRGAAVAAVELDHARSVLRFAGVGNISAMIFDGLRGRGLASYNGTVGHRLHKVQIITSPWPEKGLLVMYSDGLMNRWRFEDYPGLRQRHPALVAAVLYRDFQRGRDDVTVLALDTNSIRHRI